MSLCLTLRKCQQQKGLDIAIGHLGVRLIADSGEELTEKEVPQPEAIVRVARHGAARRGVHGEAGERRLKRDRDADELAQLLR